MSVEKISVSFELDLGGAIRESAAASGTSVSAWLADAARDRLRAEALGEAITSWQAVHGALSDDEVAAAERLLDRAAAKRSASPAA